MMLPFIIFVLVAVCCSPGAGAPDIRRQRDVQDMQYTYHQGGAGGGGGGSGGYSGTQVKPAQFSKDEAQMFSFLFQACCCLYNSVRNGPPEKKPELYRFFVENTIGFVNTFARSSGSTPEGLFQTTESYNTYLELLKIHQNGQYGNIPHVEHTCDGVLAGLSGGVAKLLESVGCTVSEIANSLTCLLGGLAGPLVGNIVQAAGGVVSGLTSAVSGILGGVLGTVGGLTGGLTGGLLSGGGGGGSGGGGGLLGGLTGGLLGGGGGGGSGGGGGLLGGALNTVGGVTGGLTGGLLGGGGGGAGGLLG